jgi:hypothetical protein
MRPTPPPSATVVVDNHWLFRALKDVAGSVDFKGLIAKLEQHLRVQCQAKMLFDGKRPDLGEDDPGQYVRSGLVKALQNDYWVVNLRNCKRQTCKNCTNRDWVQPGSVDGQMMVEINDTATPVLVRET